LGSNKFGLSGSFIVFQSAEVVQDEGFKAQAFSCMQKTLEIDDFDFIIGLLIPEMNQKQWHN
jgi:hypothetical protein